MGYTLFLPFVRVIAGCSAFLAALYLLIGMDPSAPVGNLVVDYIDLTLPMAGRVAGFWVFYSIFYLCLRSFDVDLRVVGLFLGRSVRFWRRRAFRPWFESVDVVRAVTPPSLLRIRHLSLPVWLAVGWRAGDSALLDYD